MGNLDHGSVDFGFSSLKLPSRATFKKMMFDRSLALELFTTKCLKGKDSHEKTVGQRYSSQVSEKEACALANAFWEEVRELAGARNIHNAGFLQVCSRLATTRHENSLSANLEKHGLSAAIPIQHIDVGLKIPHPILAVSDFIVTLNKRSKMDILLNGNRAEQLRAFWKRWKYLQPDHEKDKVARSYFAAISLLFCFFSGLRLSKSLEASSRNFFAYSFACSFIPSTLFPKLLAPCQCFEV